MAPRPATRRERINDFSAVGQIGRRTGITLPQGRLNEDGFEEVTGMFSSPIKPSPLRKSTRATTASSMSELLDSSGHMSGIDSTGITPTQVLDKRKSMRGPSLQRSSPVRKTGITGKARRSTGVNLFSPEKEMPQFDPEDRENTPNVSPVQPSQHATRRFSPSPEKSPLRDITTMGARSPKGKGKAVEPGYNDIDHEPAQRSDDDEGDESEQAVQSIENTTDVMQDNLFEDMEYNGGEDMDYSHAANHEPKTLSPSHLEPSSPKRPEQPKQPTQANSRRKRKADILEEEMAAASSPSLQAKQRRAANKDASKQTSIILSTIEEPSSELPTRPAPKKRGRPLKSAMDSQISEHQQSKLNEIIEKVKARPGQQKSLYILRRETPADDTVSHTRSGRLNIKPLAYWRNERCVYGGTPGGSQLADGARFPLNSIKEIVRTEEVDPKPSRKNVSGKKGKSRGRSESHRIEYDSDDEEVAEDPHAESWETDIGTFRGNVSVWDSNQQAPLEVEEEADLAYAPASIQTREIKGSSFKYAKLLSTKFFGAGIVDLEPGTEKRPKNSRKMLMSFFVAKGRVTVTVGPWGVEPSTFSVGKGGFWTVPRGNQYSIKNDLEKPAKIFFSQGCETFGDEE